MFGEMDERKTFRLIESKPVDPDGVPVHNFERIRD
jgi:hypothetical protein